MLGGAGKSPEVNEEVGRAESMSIIDDEGVGACERKRTGKHSPQT